MQKLRILNSKEIKRIHATLNSQFGHTKKLDYAFLKSTKNKLYIIHKDIQKLDLDKIRKDTMGMYFGTEHDDGIRLSIEGAQLIGKHCTKNILTINDQELEKYLQGHDLTSDSFRPAEINTGEYYILKHKKDFLGSAKATGQKIMTFIPKARRLKVMNTE